MNGPAGRSRAARPGCGHQENDIDTVLDLMDDEVVFMTPGAEPFGKQEFESASRGRDVAVDGTGEILELQVAGDWAWMRTHLTVRMTPPMVIRWSARATASRSCARHPTAGGSWRDANLLPPP